MCCWHICVGILKGSDWSAEFSENSEWYDRVVSQLLKWLCLHVEKSPERTNRLSFNTDHQLWVVYGFTATAELASSASVAR